MTVFPHPQVEPSMMLPLRCALFGAVLLLSSPVRADSVIVGAVVSALDKKPVSDVLVTASSPALTGERLVLTDAQGQYRLPQMPPGVYTLRFDKESFRLFTRSEVQLRPARTIRVNVELLPEGVTELPQLTGRLPTLDTSIGCTGGISGDFVKRIPVDRPGRGDTLRPFQSLLAFAPRGAWAFP
jgi:hypothetical protein